MAAQCVEYVYIRDAITFCVYHELSIPYITAIHIITVSHTEC